MNASRLRPLLAVLVIGAGVGIAYVSGVFGESDQDRLNAIADDFRGELNAVRLDAAIAHVDTSVAPLEVSAQGFTRVYGNGAIPDLKRDANRALSSYMGTTFRELGRTVAVGDDGRSGQATLQLLSEHGSATVELTFARDGERWLVRRVIIRR
ncbi:MAG: hypothetical protein JJ863_15245 [Deltaproteobacteria bacterium]|nr:hypothetical protein [Deltaproteobacteria bacterium]